MRGVMQSDRVLLQLPARQSRARERRCPNRYSNRVPQYAEARTELMAQLFPSITLGPASVSEVDLSLIEKYVSQLGTERLRVQGLNR